MTFRNRDSGMRGHIDLRCPIYMEKMSAFFGGKGFGCNFTHRVTGPEYEIRAIKRDGGKSRIGQLQDTDLRFAVVLKFFLLFFRY